MNEELRDLFQADQDDRLSGQLPADLIRRDRARRRRVAEVLEANEGLTAEDFFHAAMTFQHGEAPDDYERAHQLALRAAELGHGPARWLAAAALDRWLMNQGRPQKYGTQYTASGDEWELYPVDPETTDEERARWDVPSLAEAQATAVSMSKDRPPRGFTGLITTLRGGGLEVNVVRVLSRVPEKPCVRPLEREDALPWLPAGLNPVRVHQGLGAVDQFGELMITWYHRPAGTPIAVGWNDQEGSPPDLEPVKVGERSGAWCPSMGGWNLLAVRSDRGHLWIVAGRCARHELLRVAETLS